MHALSDKFPQREMIPLLTACLGRHDLRSNKNLSAAPMSFLQQNNAARLIVPKKGPIVPFLGPLAAMSSLPLSDALFSSTQQRILGLLFGRPGQSFYANEIARWANVGKGSVMRELDRLHRSGILTVHRQGNQTHYQANSACPIYAELLGIVRKTFGVAEQLKSALQPFAAQLSQAFIYGSIAQGAERSGSDIDLLLIGDDLSYSDVMEHLLAVEDQLGRTINPTLYTPADWESKKAAGNSFVIRVDAQDKIDVLGERQRASE